MQDSYAFDVGDFGKFGLLRHLLVPSASLRLGVVWYRTAPSNASTDGRHLGYLELSRSTVSSKGARFRSCDAVLYDRFREHFRASNGERSVSLLESLGVLPAVTSFYADVVRPGKDREHWFLDALEAMSSLTDRLGTSVMAARFRRGTSRAFFIVPGRHTPDLLGRIEPARHSAWVRNGHLELFGPRGEIDLC